MELEEAILNRRSIRKYKQEDISTSQVEELLRLASWAPSANNFQMWFFYAIHSRETREKIAQAIEEKLEEVLSWPELQALKERLSWMSRYARFIREAPWLIVFCMDDYKSAFEEILIKKGFDKEKLEKWRPHAEIQSVSAAIQNFLLAAHARGFGAVWMVGPLFAVEELEKILEIPQGRRILALVPLGYPDEKPEPKPRKNPEDTWKFIL
ncbi:MAG: nitroreductase family protein [Caldiserica bacterium]|jgi:nitroreductase|nr:nitroreductase family protein [Caldisericota bacterium]MDH7563051.1 nitroreductase family protein [Caldisericota bacterium]